MDQYYEKLYFLKDKEHYVTAQVVQGPWEGSRAIFHDGEILYQEESPVFWAEVLQAAETVISGTIIEVSDSRVYLERLAEPLKMVLCGAGHVSIPVIRLAKMIGFHVTVLDDREEFAGAAKQAGADETVCASFEEALSRIKGDGSTYFAIITRGHMSDRLCLEEILQKPHAYIGMIGSRSRVAKQLADMEMQGFPKEALAEVHTPIGLSIGAETPEEIAVSIMAEIIQVKNAAVKKNGFDRKMLRYAANLDPEKNGQKKAVAVIVEKSGSGPRNVGTKMLVFEDGTICGTIGGGKLEYDTIQKAMECMQDKSNAYMDYEMQLKEAWEEGMACGGRAGIYIDVIDSGS